MTITYSTITMLAAVLIPVAVMVRALAAHIHRRPPQAREQRSLRSVGGR